MMFKRSFDKARSFGRIPTSCPLVAGNYYVKNFKFGGELMPPMFVHTKLRTNFELFYNDVNPVEMITEVKFYWDILKIF
jgi:Protein of unknown function (DUF1091)